jgi:hypothetical protein
MPAAKMTIERTIERYELAERSRYYLAAEAAIVEYAKHAGCDITELHLEDHAPLLCRLRALPEGREVSLRTLLQNVLDGAVTATVADEAADVILAGDFDRALQAASLSATRALTSGPIERFAERSAHEAERAIAEMESIEVRRRVLLRPAITRLTRALRGHGDRAAAEAEIARIEALSPEEVRLSARGIAASVGGGA